MPLKLMAETIRVLYMAIEKPEEGLVRIFAFNKAAFKDLTSMLRRREYSRRCLIEVVPKNFIINNIIVNSN